MLYGISITYRGDDVHVIRAEIRGHCHAVTRACARHVLPVLRTSSLPLVLPARVREPIGQSKELSIGTLARGAIIDFAPRTRFPMMPPSRGNGRNVDSNRGTLREGDDERRLLPTTPRRLDSTRRDHPFSRTA